MSCSPGYEVDVVPGVGARAARTCSPQEAIEALRGAGRVFFGGTASLPLGLIERLEADRSRWSDLEVVFGYLLERPSLCDHAGAPFRVLSLQPSACIADDVVAGSIDYLPTTYGGIAAALGPGGAHRIDALVVQVSPPDDAGMVSLGVSNGPLGALIPAVPLVVAQVNRHVPRTFGSLLSVRSFDVLCPMDVPLVELPSRPAGEAVTGVARRVAELVVDGATLQTGVGGVPDAVLGQLGHRSGLRMHTGMVGDAVGRLEENGSLAPGTTAEPAIVTAEVVGSRALFDWVDGNPRVALVGSERSHRGDPGPGPMIAVNGGIEVALDGALNSEFVGDRRVSGAGGLPDFLRTVFAAPGRSSVIGLVSAGRTGSRIVEVLGPGRTTAPPHQADHVVTEWGAASLRGASMAERRRALVEVAHPDHRGSLQGPSGR